MREVPDSQEVFVDATSGASVIVELVERADVQVSSHSLRTGAELTPAPQDEGSAAYFWGDAASLNDCGDAVRSRWLPAAGAPLTLGFQVCDCSQPLDLGELPHLASAAAAASLACGVQAPRAVQPGRSPLPPAYVCLACVRLPRVGTDLLLTLHVPPAGSPQAAETARALLLGVLRSLQVVDWTLFCAKQ